MNALYLQILVGVGVMIGVIIAFILSIKSGQYDDLDSPAHRILMDDDDPRIPGNSPVKKVSNKNIKDN
ncbi:MAG: cbb3-type cytochrome oxidase assembly protein CcoS [Thiotrichaceae bacterium]